MSATVYFLTFLALAIHEVHLQSTTNACGEHPVVSTRLGSVRGSILRADHGTDIRAFRGIPYAEPPIGGLRFKASRPKLAWGNGTVLNATHDGSQCLQTDSVTGKTIGNENCLFLNVYSPKVIPAKTLLPVMVFIHQGNFMTGSGSSALVGPQRLVADGVVLVAMNYRLGAFGFLSTADAASPGNYGLKDQIESLRWVQANIKYFGGNPSQVTVFGEGAGGISALMHMTSPLAKGLFRAVIGESGTAICDWPVVRNPRQWSTILSNNLSCRTNDTTKMVACLKAAPAQSIVTATKAINDMKDYLETVKFQPTLEPAQTTGAYMTEFPWIRFKRGDYYKVPVILGITRDEGYFMYSAVSQKYGAWGVDHKKILAASIRRYLPGLKMNNATLQKSLVDEYFTGKESPAEVEKKIVRIYGDASFGRCADDGAALLAENGTPTYVYKFSYANATDKTGFVNHMAELQYLFRTDLFPKNKILYGKDVIISEWLISLWTNFAKIMRPTFDNCKVTPPVNNWTPMQLNQPKYYRIDVNATMLAGPLTDKAAFWKRLAG